MSETMKKIFILISAAAGLFAASSCSDRLELSPTAEIASANMWTNPNLARSGIVGLYKPFYRDASKVATGSQLRWENYARNGGFGGYAKYLNAALEFCTDYYSNNYPVQYLSFQAKQASWFFFNYEWKFGFQLVHSCNDAIANLHKAGLDEATYNDYQCQAHFLRAYAYSHLNKRFWGVPIYDKPISVEECTKGQSSAEDVWNFVIADCSYCIENQFFANNKIAEGGAPSKGAAYALRGMAYMWLKDWDNAIADFEKVAECGYSLYNPGSYAALFTEENEHSPEMIFSIQYDAADGYGDNIQQAVGARDTYNGWTEIKPAADFVDYYQNADGSKFNWSDIFPDWNSLTPKQRAVFFCRDGLKSNPRYSAQKATAIGICGQAAFDRYYLDNGNEARIKAAYDNRDPRLKQTVVTPYEPVDCYRSDLNNGEDMIGKQLRWPLYEQGVSGGDFWLDKRTSAYYAYRKFVCFLKDDNLLDSNHSYIDFPLIRFTDVLLLQAEALVEKGGDGLSTAAGLINQVRSRAGMPPVQVGSQDEMREAVRYERRVEFPVEGINYFDEVRWGTWKEMKFQGKDIHGGQSWWGDDTVEYSWYYDDCMWPWAAPYAVTIMNPNIKPTPGYVY